MLRVRFDSEVLRKYIFGGPVADYMKSLKEDGLSIIPKNSVSISRPRNALIKPFIFTNKVPIYFDFPFLFNTDRDI